jgi:hypothetical protein
MPSSVGNFSFPNPPPLEPAPKGKTWHGWISKDQETGALTDLHIKATGGEKLHVHGAGLGGQPRLSPTDAAATFNIEGQDTSEITFSNLNVPDPGTFDARIEATSAGGKLPKLTWNWTSNGKTVEWKNGQAKSEFEMRAVGAPP